VTSSDGVGIATYDLGGDGPPLLFCHATGFHGPVWLPLAAHLVGDFHCVAFDFRGHGHSDKAPGDDYAWSGFARDVLAVIAGLALDRPVAAGHSAGGAALLLAEQQSAGTFQSIYCYEPVVFAEGAVLPGRANAMAEGTRRRREEFGSREEAYLNYTTKPPLSAFDPAAVRAYVDYGFEDLADGRVRLLCRREDEARVYEMAQRHDAFRQLADVACPVTVACGGEEPHFGPQAIGAMAARLPRGATEVIADLGHFGPMERPAEVAASIRRALDGPAHSRHRSSLA
jgi:pimeloyl-ACP methyl ester carboxylesterase